MARTPIALLFNWPRQPHAQKAQMTKLVEQLNHIINKQQQQIAELETKVKRLESKSA